MTTITFVGLRELMGYFGGVGTEISHEVHVHTDVHHYVVEGLSVAELIKKIGDMQRDFQSRITVVEQYVKYHKTSGIGSDSPLNNVFSNKIEFDHDPSCVFDNHVKLRDKESMYVDRDVKVSSENLINDEALEEPHVAGKNFIDEEDQQFSLKNLEVPLDGEECFAVQSLMQMIDFDLPKEADSVQGSNDAKVTHT
nr:hypothetical protein [Tanacetum cinerariifolium]